MRAQSIRTTRRVGRLMASLAVAVVMAAAFAPAADAKVWFDMRGLVLRWDEPVAKTVAGCPGNESCRAAVGGIMVYLRRGPGGRRTAVDRPRRLGRITPSGTVKFRVPRVSSGRYHLVGSLRAGHGRRTTRVSNAFRIVVPSVTAARGACPVTSPNGNTPPGERPSPQHHGRGLWTVLPPDGRLVVVPHGSPMARDHVAVDRIEPDGAIGIKFPWWGAVDAGGRLRITGRRLDGPAPPLRASISGGSTGAPHFWATGLNFPRAGCWEVTGRAGGARLTFVLSFVDRVTDRSAHARARPTPASRGCRVTRPNRRAAPYGAAVDVNHGADGLWTVLPHRGTIVAVRPGSRLTPDTVVIHERPSADGALPVYFPWVRSGRRHVRVTGRRLDAPGSLRASTRHITHTSTRVRFPSAGCWKLTARSGAARVTFVVFVLDEVHRRKPAGRR